MQIKDIIDGLNVIQNALARILGMLDAMDEQEHSFFHGESAARSAASEDSQLNKATALLPRNNPKGTDSKENIMPNKIKHISVYQRKNGYYHAVAYINGKRKDFCGKNKNAVTQRAKEALAYLCNDVSDIYDFYEFSQLWLENVKKPFVTANYYETLEYRLNNHIYPLFKNKALKDIKPFTLQKFFNELCKKSTRSAEDVKVILNQIFEYAVGNGIIATNPMRAVKVLKHERTNGKALTPEDLKYFKLHINDYPEYRIPFLVALYTGTRPSEIPSVILNREKGCISVLNAKKKRFQKKTRREIPILPPLLPYVDEIAAYDFSSLKSLSFWEKKFKRILPNYEPKDLRHTFQTYTRLTCSKEMVNLWTGHSLGADMTDKVYNHIPWEEQKKQAATVFY